MAQTKFSFKDTLKENLALAVYNTGYEVCERGYTWGPAVRDHYLLHYVRSGKGMYVYNGQEFHLGAGDMFLTYPSTVVSYTADTEEPWEYCWVGFHGTEAKRMLRETAFSKQQPTIHLTDCDRLETLLLSIYRSSGNTPAADADMAGYLYLFLGELMRCAPVNTARDNVQDYVTQAIRYIQNDYAKDIQISEIASYVGVSRSQLYRAFVERFELSPHQYLKRYRINVACTLLRNATLSVREIAASVGIEDPLYFSRVFKEVKGISPSEYQRNRGENGNGT